MKIEKKEKRKLPIEEERVKSRVEALLLFGDGSREGWKARFQHLGGSYTRVHLNWRDSARIHSARDRLISFICFHQRATIFKRENTAAARRQVA